MSIFLMGACPILGQEKRAAIAFDDLDRDFGESTEGEVLTHVFKFTNQGQTVLEIIGLQPSCGCTSALLSEKRIPPGQSGQISVKLNTHGLSGRLIKEVGVVTNDPQKPEVRLRLQTIVRPEIVVSERSVYFGVVPKDKGAKREVTLTVPSDRDILILDAASTDQNVTVEMKTVPDTAGRMVRLILSLKPAAEEGYHFGNIVIKTTSHLNPQLFIPVRGFIKVEEKK